MKLTPNVRNRPIKCVLWHIRSVKVSLECLVTNRIAAKQQSEWDLTAVAVFIVLYIENMEYGTRFIRITHLMFLWCFFHPPDTDYFCFMEKGSVTFCKTYCFVFRGWKKIIFVWNNTRVNNWWWCLCFLKKDWCFNKRMHRIFPAMLWSFLLFAVNSGFCFAHHSCSQLLVFIARRMCWRLLTVIQSCPRIAWREGESSVLCPRLILHATPSVPQ